MNGLAARVRPVVTRALSSSAGPALFALSVTAVSVSVLLALGGFNPFAAGAALVKGAVGSPAALAVTATRTVPLALAGLAVAFAFRAGVWNIGAEGQIYAGAVGAIWVGLILGPAVADTPILAVGVTATALLSSAIAGAAWAAVPAGLLVGRGVNEVVSTILLNFVAIHLVSLLVGGPLQERRGIFQQTDQVVEAVRIPALVPGTRVHLGLALAFAAGIGLWAFFRWTRLGFRVRAVGAAPRAAASAGLISVDRIKVGALLCSGALAGVAGGVEVLGVTFALYAGLSPGWGYVAIAVALLGGLRPPTVLAAAVLFGVLESGGAAMQRQAGVPSTWVSVVVATIIVAVLFGEAMGRRLRG